MMSPAMMGLGTSPNMCMTTDVKATANERCCTGTDSMTRMLMPELHMKRHTHPVNIMTRNSALEVTKNTRHSSTVPTLEAVVISELEDT